MDPSLLLYGALAVVLVLAAAYAALILLSPKPIRTHASEQSYRSRLSPSKPLALPSLFDEPTIDLTVVIPAYNEVERLPSMLNSALVHLQQLTSASTSNGKANGNGALPPKRTYEIIIVDDGSHDNTASFALQLSQQSSQPSNTSSSDPAAPAPLQANFSKADIRVVSLVKNLGKGGAVRHGMLHGRGKRLLMVDADGASRFEDLEGLWKALDKVEEESGITGKEREKGGVPAVAVGSRAHLVKTDAVVKRSFIRNFLMFSLHLILRIVGVAHIRDTQCGFKLFTRKAAQQIFPHQHLTTWIFDVELLLLAQTQSIPVEEVPIEWHEVEGSKLNVMLDSLGMLRDLVVLRGNMILGRWRAVDVGKKKGVLGGRKKKSE